MSDIAMLAVRTSPEREQPKDPAGNYAHDDKVVSARALVTSALQRRSETLASIQGRTRRPTRW